MKKVLIGVLTLIMVLGLVGCNSSTDSSTTSTTKKNTDYNVDEKVNKKILSESEKGEMAEDAAMEEILDYMENNSKFYKYDISSSKYTVTNIDSYGADYHVKGSLYLYDKYGYLEDTATFDCKVTFFDDRPNAYLPDITIR